MKVGEPVLPFIMKSVTGQSIDSFHLRGKNILLVFDLFFEPPVFKKSVVIKELNEYDHLREDLDLVMIRMTITDSARVIQNGGEIIDRVAVVPGANNFFRRYGISRFPQYMVIDQMGIVQGYLNSADWQRITEILEDDTK